MTPQELKNSILQMAIQGKLVPQDPHEGTGEELYKSIQNEKYKLIREGSIKKEKPLPEITDDEIPFDIPENWKWIRFGELARVEAGGTPDRNNPEYWNGNIPWVKIGDISSKYVDSTSEFITDKGLCNSSAKIFPAGTLLYTIFATIGTVGILKIDAATNQAIAGITLYSGIDTDYIYHVSVGLKYLLVAKAHGMAQLNINQKILKSTPIPLPPLAEQKRIAAKIEELLPLINRYEEAWSKLENFNKHFPLDMQKSILQMAIQGKLVPQDPHEGTGEELFRQIQAQKAKLIKEGKIKKMNPPAKITEEEIPFEIPNSWKWVRINDVIDVRDGTHDTPKYVVNGVPLVTSKNLVDGHIDFDTAKNISEKDAKLINLRSGVDDGDILFAMIGTIGNPVLVKKEREFSIKNMALFKQVNASLFEMKYLLYFLKKVQTDMKKAASASVQSFVSLSLLRNYLLPLPPLTEQKRIVAKIEELLPLCERLNS